MEARAGGEGLLRFARDDSLACVGGAACNEGQE